MYIQVSSCKEEPKSRKRGSYSISRKTTVLGLEYNMIDLTWGARMALYTCNWNFSVTYC